MHLTKFINGKNALSFFSSYKSFFFFFFFWKCTQLHFCSLFFSAFVFFVRHCLRSMGSLWTVRCGVGEGTGVERCGGRRRHPRYAEGGVVVGKVRKRYRLSWSGSHLRINLIRKLIWFSSGSSWSVSDFRINLIRKLVFF